MLNTSQSYYQGANWDLAAWLHVVAVEYESLLASYPFQGDFERLSQAGELRLLDVGCGTGIFPTYLDAQMGDGVHLRADLLDVSTASLEAARANLARLAHFEPGEKIQGLIEDIPSLFAGQAERYHLIWAMHSFTTVDVAAMPAVLQTLYRALKPGGFFYIYQLAAGSSYQRLHAYYRTRHPRGAGSPPYMEYEQSLGLLNEAGIAYQTRLLAFDHIVDPGQPELLQNYLRKCVLDEQLEAEDFFAPWLSEFRDSSGAYRFPQQVNLIIIHKG